MATEHGKEVAVIDAQSPMLKLTEVAIETIQHNIQMAQKLVTGVLETDIDYGRIPGVKGESLFDPGASKIMAAFNSYARHEVLYHVEEDNLVSWALQALIVNRDTQTVVATGIGAASTRETKYKYRWEFSPQSYGYTPEEIKALKFKDGKYRIPNPEYGELVNTLFQMAAKRAEVDAARSLPGVGSALKKLFAPGGERKAPDWPGFWGRVAQMGISEDEVHTLLGIGSMNDWIAKGGTLEGAITALVRKLAQRRPPAGEAPSEGQPQAVSPPLTRSPETITNLGELAQACYEDFGVTWETVLRESGYARKEDIRDPWQAYQQVAATRP